MSLYLFAPWYHYETAMKKLLLSASLIATFMLYVIYGQKGSSPGYAPSAINLPQLGGVTMNENPIIDIAPASRVTAPMLVPIPASESKGVYKDGEYVGKIVDVYYGNLEVGAIIENGKLTDVKFLQYPNDRQTSIAISRMAIPALKEEAIRAQSGTVDIISGATATSEGFVESMSDALDKAKR